MGGKTRAVQARIKSVSSIQQITRAMELVATSRLRQAQLAVQAAAPYADEVAGVLGRMLVDNPTLRHPLLDGRRLSHTLIVLLSTNRGLCGGYNANLLNKALAVEAAEEVSCSYLVVGKKGRDGLKKNGKKMIAEFCDREGVPTYRDADVITQVMVDAFQNRSCDRVVLVYTEFVSALRQDPMQKILLPLSPEFDSEVPSTAVFYEPSLVKVVERLVPEYVTTTVYDALISSFASEFAARRMAMKSATENANDAIDKLKLQYNRARQGAITQELAEIVGGASALN